MPTIEITVKNLDDAAATAAEQMGVAASDVKITVIEESKKLFGKVSYKVRAEAADPVAEAPKKPTRAVTKAKPEAPVVTEEAEAPAEEVAVAPAAGSARKKLGAKTAPVEAPKAETAKAEAAPAAAKPSSRRSAPAATADAAQLATSDAPAEVEGPEIIATQADADVLMPIFKTILDGSGLVAEVRVTEIQGKYINLAIDGQEASYFIGKSGEVLNSLQYIFNLVTKQQLGNGVRISLDGNDFRKTREDALTSLAMQIADKVKERGEEAVLEALPAFERRVIHKALQEAPGIMTYSEGEEPDRRVVIAPTD